jgi:hypothetical protein
MNQTAVGTKPQVRNALMTFLMPTIVMIGGQIVGNILATAVSPSLAIVGSLVGLAGFIMYAMSLMSMTKDLNAVTGGSLAWWMLLIPIYGPLVLLPGEMAKAKQMAGKAAPRGAVVYLFLTLYAYASDLNDIAA